MEKQNIVFQFWIQTFNQIFEWMFIARHCLLLALFQEPFIILNRMDFYTKKNDQKAAHQLYKLLDCGDFCVENFYRKVSDDWICLPYSWSWNQM